jgi:tetratricopeptide (TPR) repeat protein
MRLSLGLALGSLTLAAGPAWGSQDQPILSAEAEFERFARSAKRLFLSGRYAEALQMSREAHAFAAAELGPTHPFALRALNDIAVIHQLRGDYDTALPIALRAAGELERTAGPDHAETLNALANLAQLHLSRGEKALAEPLLRRVFSSRERVFGAADEATLNALLELAIYLKKEGRLRELTPRLTAAAEASIASQGADSAITRDLTAAAAEARLGRQPGAGTD